MRSGNSDSHIASRELSYSISLVYFTANVRKINIFLNSLINFSLKVSFGRNRRHADKMVFFFNISAHMNILLIFIISNKCIISKLSLIFFLKFYSLNKAFINPCTCKKNCKTGESQLSGFWFHRKIFL